MSILPVRSTSVPVKNGTKGEFAPFTEDWERDADQKITNKLPVPAEERKQDGGNA